MKTVYYLLLGLCIAMAACKPEEPELPKEPNQSIDEDINDTYNNILTWTYDTINATLTISGSGSMEDFHSSYDPAPWYAYKKDIRTVIIGDSVTYIGKYAFYDCDGLATITIPNSVTSIGGYAFADCDGLKQITLPDKLESIEENTFYNCDLLTEINIPASVTSIGIEAFKYCYNLTKIAIGNGVTSIGNYAFRHCSALTQVTIGNGVESIGMSAFDDCYMLTAVYYTGDVAGWCRITFESYDSNPLYYAQNLYIGNTLVTELVIPEGVTEIKDCAFYGCTALTQMTIPNNVTSIGDYAFCWCEALTDMTVMAIVPPTTRWDAFYGVSRDIPVYVPAESLEAYKAAEGWKEFTNLQAIPQTCKPYRKASYALFIPPEATRFPAVFVCTATLYPAFSSPPVMPAAEPHPAGRMRG